MAGGRPALNRVEGCSNEMVFVLLDAPRLRHGVGVPRRNILSVCDRHGLYRALVDRTAPLCLCAHVIVVAVFGTSVEG